MVFLPENFAFMGSNPDENDRMKEFLDGTLIKRYSQIAQDNSVWLSLGGFQEKIEATTKRYNTHIIVDDKGNIQASYRKLHLFDV